MQFSTSDIPEKNVLNLAWLLKLRWGAFVGQLVTILGAYYLLGIDIPRLPLLSIVGFGALSNTAATFWLQKPSRDVKQYHLAAVMSLDIVLLTLLLFFTGGPQNPFSVLYLVNIALAAVALHAQWTWMLVALALLGMGVLPFLAYHSLPVEGLSLADRESIFQKGKWVAIGVTAGFIVHFLWRITSALAVREEELGAARQMSERQIQLASLARVAAGAAHELATPLGTIALVAKELERSMEGASQGNEALEDVRLIRDQVARCRLILDQMGGGLGRSSEQVVERTDIACLIQDALIGVRSEPAVLVEVDDEARTVSLELPGRAVSQALRGLITNAQDASEHAMRVLVQGKIENQWAKVIVSDAGRGMSKEVLARVSEPFFTTKPPGHGMGLGLYLTRAVVESLGGSLQIESKAGQGTQVCALLPLKVDIGAIQEYPQQASDV